MTEDKIWYYIRGSAQVDLDFKNISIRTQRIHILSYNLSQLFNYIEFRYIQLTRQRNRDCRLVIVFLSNVYYIHIICYTNNKVTVGYFEWR